MSSPEEIRAAKIRAAYATAASHRDGCQCYTCDFVRDQATPEEKRRITKMATEPRKIRFPHNRLCVCRDCESVRILENNGLIVAVDPTEPVPQQVPDEMGLLNSYTAGEKSAEAKRREAREKLAAAEKQVGQDRRLDNDLEANRARAKARQDRLGAPQSGR